MPMDTTVPTLPPVLQPKDVENLMEAGTNIRILDVRTPAEFESLHIPGSYNVPLDTLGEHGPELRAHVNEPVVLVCRSGERARKADEALRKGGMTNLHVLEGGMMAWERHEYPMRRGGERWGLERQVRLIAGSLVVIGVVGGVLVHPALMFVAGFVGAGLTFSGITNTCGMAMVLAKLPYNRRSTCDVKTMVEALKQGQAPEQWTAAG